MAEFLVASELTAADGGGRIVHGFFTRRGGVSEGLHASLNMGRGSSDLAANVALNRAAALDALGGSRLLTPYQVHGADVWTVDAASDPDAPPRADAVVSRTEGLMIGVLTADCCPVLFADPGAGVIGAAHAGWRGLAAGVLEATLVAMESLGAARDRIVAVAGPSIAHESYEVGEDMRAECLAHKPGLEGHFVPSDREGHYRFDLVGSVRHCLACAGIRASGAIGRDCYAEETMFFSYRRATHRREPDYGRQLSAILLRPA